MSGRSAWPSRDPLEEQGGLNLYSFIGNDSINANDFQGFINSVSALAHYIGGSGDPLRMSFNEIDTSGVTPSQFPDVKAKLPSKISVCKDEKISFGNAKMGFQTSGDQWLYLGRIVLKLQGTLTIKCGCSWEFHGTLKAFDDLYDFDKGNRTWLAETATTIGRMFPGKPFYIEIRGSKPADETSGSK